MDLNTSKRVLGWEEAGKRFLADVARRTGAAGRKESAHLRDLRTKLARVARECGWQRLDQVRADEFTAFLGKLAEAGRSPRTQNFYLQRVGSFLGWCVQQGWLQSNPLERVAAVKVGQAGRRRLRRAFSAEELGLLCAAATAGRAMVYRVAAFSGFRRSELLRLRKEDCTPTGDRPRWHVDASRTKNGQPVKLPMAPECAAALREHWEALPAGSPLFPRGHDREERCSACGVPTNRALRRDRTAAGIAHKDERGRWVDFHSLRYTFCTFLARIYPIEVVSRFMRHSSIQLTAGIYLDLGLDREGEGEWTLPRLAPGAAPPASPPAGPETSEKPREKA